MLERIMTVDMLVAVVGLLGCIVWMKNIYKNCTYNDHTREDN